MKKYVHSERFLFKQRMKRLNTIPETQWDDADIQFMSMVSLHDEITIVLFYGDFLRCPENYEGLEVR